MLTDILCNGICDLPRCALLQHGARQKGIKDVDTDGNRDTRKLTGSFKVGPGPSEGGKTEYIPGGCIHVVGKKSLVD